MIKKEILKESKYWRRNDVFFTLEVKVSLLIDSPMVFLQEFPWPVDE